ncbi:DnaD domain protein [Eubacterium oxidoreducens]|uniref:DnaD and phage-associated domain-containing protein n=1 Tax=Eubacterium oxidoreducens TaxID=1732 RepID=A0A1G6BW05_EUBOX|nr:DnaD domain protein [Eubacterium oxidoreducens]SDB24764.1 DnaD and phage-associated domain-containing protein [Eubacterium oxidoreducens]
MSNIKICTEKSSSYTNIPDFFVDQYMAKANGEYVKVYLYLLRLLHAPNAQLSITHMADFFDHTEKDIRRALKYWEKENLIRLDYDADCELSSICFLAPHSAQSSLHANITQPPTPVTPVAPDVPAQNPTKHEYSLDEISGFKKKADIKELLFIAETYLRRTLSNTDCQTLLYLHDQVGLSVELIEYLIEYCIEKGHSSIRYIEKTGLAWHEKGYQTVSEAKANNKIYTKSHTAVMKAFGIKGRNLVDSELQTINHWSKDFGFSADLISEACNRTMASIHTPSFEYVEKILESWHQQKVTKLDDLVALDENHANAARNTYPKKNNNVRVNKNSGFSNFSQRNYNYDQLEQQLLHTGSHR